MEKNNDRMGVIPVKKLMLSMGIPMVISMVLQAVYNIVDSAFVANMEENGELALNALTLAFPVQMLMVAVGIGTGVGANAMLSKCLGSGDSEKAGKTAGNAVFLGIVIYAIFLLFGIFGTEAYAGTQTENPVILEMTVDYLRICCCASVGIVFFSVFEKLLQAGGHSVQSTIAQISGAVVNIILDPIMIYGLLGCPEMGVKGAAYATVIGQIASFVIALILYLKVSRNIPMGISYIKPSKSVISEIYSIGLAAVIAQALMSFMTYGLNIILGTVSEEMVTAYGLYYKVQQFVLFAAFGLRDAITPIIAFSRGMGSDSRVKDGVKYGMIYTLTVMLAGTLLLEIFAVPFCGMFGLSGETYALCISAMQIISVSFVFAGANIAFQGVFQALGGGIQSLVISLCRQLVIIFPLVIAAAHFTRIDTGMSPLVWAAFPVCELLTAAVSFMLYKRFGAVKTVRAAEQVA